MPSWCTGDVRADMTRLFISHSSKDDDFVRELQRAIGDLDQDLRIDSRQLRGGDPSWSEIQEAIEEAEAFAVVVSPDALQSQWVRKDLRHALELQKLLGKDKFAVIALSLDDSPFSAFEEDFGQEPVSITVRSAAGGAKAVIDPILIALGKGRPTDAPTSPVAPPIPALLVNPHLEAAQGKHPQPFSADGHIIESRQLSGPDALGLVQRASNQDGAGARDAAAIAKGAAWDHAMFQAQQTRVQQQLAKGQLREAFDGAQQLLHQAHSAGDTAYPDADYDMAMASVLLARVLSVGGRAEQALPLLCDAQEYFEAIARERASTAAERMAAKSIAEQGDCLTSLGRPDEAAAAYEENIRRAEKLGDARQVAVGKGQLGTVRVYQQRYQEALQAYEEARNRFAALDEPGSVAVAWRQTGVVYQEAGELDAAADAYRTSLAITVQHRDDAGQADTLNQLGSLYDSMGRPEEAVACFKQAAVKYVKLRDTAKEGAVRSKLADAFRALRRLNEARQEIRRAIECNAQFGHATFPWNSWSSLASIETDAGEPAAAAEARQAAIQCYLAYRRDGGENHSGSGRLVFDMTKALRVGGAAVAAEFLAELAADPRAAGPFCTFIQALDAVVRGSRDRRLADPPDLDITMAAEVLLLIETLESRG